MARRILTLLLCASAFLLAGGAAVASGAAPAAAVRPAAGSGDGVDPAARDAVTGKLGYHENRDYPYGLLVFLVVMTPVALAVIRRWTPRMEGESQ